MRVTLAAVLEEVGEGPCDEPSARNRKQVHRERHERNTCTHQVHPQAATMNSVSSSNRPKEIPQTLEGDRQVHSAVLRAAMFY